MAQFAHEGGGQQGFHFGYHPEWFAGSSAFASPADNLNHQQAILTQNDTALMTDFFNNPDAATVDGSYFPLSWSGMDQKAGGGDFGAHMEGFDDHSQTINPAMTLAGTSTSNYQTHSNSTHRHDMPSIPRTDVFPNQHIQASDEDSDDVKAASGLYSMFMNSQDGSRGATTFDGTAGGSWGNFGSGNPILHMQELRSPLTSSGRQSANSSYHGHTQSTTQPQHHFPNGPNQAQLMQHYLYQQQMQMQNAPRVRPASLQLDTSDFSFFPQQEHTRMPHSAQLPGQTTTRPTAVRFGSDQNFSTYGYRGPSSGVPLEHEKGANLNNVPFAAQVAANGQPHVHAFTSVGPNVTYNTYSMPSGPLGYNNTSTSSSPHSLGGLPISNMTPSTLPHGHPFHKMAPSAVVEDEVDSDDDEFEEAQPRKRRKSQMEVEDDADYSPSGHMKTHVPKRGPKATKATAMDGSDDDDYEEVTPSTTKASIKRRKSSINARPSFGSSQSGSPSAMTSPAARTMSSSKKKVRGALARQNLTEDEKRRNHIASEKTRRDLIKVQYDQLDILVPGLKGGKSGLSRSDVLKEIVTYVESIVDGNKQIETDLRMPANAFGAGAGGLG